jgi:hypothetical protein
MVVVTANTYTDFKAMIPLLGQLSADAVQIFSRDDTPPNVGFSVLAFNETQNLVIRWADNHKPASFNTDFVKAIVVRDFSVM